jgi:hypothetical protein
MTDKEKVYRLRGVLLLTLNALHQHSDGPKVAAMLIASNGPTIGTIIGRVLKETK